MSGFSSAKLLFAIKYFVEKKIEDYVIISHQTFTDSAFIDSCLK